MQATNLSEYLELYGQHLIDNLAKTSKPLWNGGERPQVEFKRPPLEAQWERIMATVSAWKAGRNGVILSAEMGTGKTICSIAAAHIHANGRPYRALVMCPPHLPKKWVREVVATIPCVNCKIIEKYTDVLAIKGRPDGAEWWIMSGNKAKLATPWRAAFVKRRNGILHCPNCNEELMKKVKLEGADVMVPCNEYDLAKRPQLCECGEALYQWTHTYDRWPVADIVQRKRRDAFRYLVIDEAHENKGATTSCGHSVAKLCSAIKYKLALTGTLLNGYADSVFPLAYRVMPQSTAKLGIAWGDNMQFVKRYGRIETVVTYKDAESYANRTSRGGGRTTNVKIKPGIVPSLYGDCMMQNSVFCSLTDLGYKLPNLIEVLEPVEMDQEMASAYRSLESDIRDNIRAAMQAGSKGAHATMLNTLIGWPDHPYGFGRIGYTNAEGEYKFVAQTEDLDPNVIRNKERKLIDVVVDTVRRGRQAWVYCEMTQKKDVQVRLQELLTRVGLKVEVMRSQKVPTWEREEWIYKNGKANVIISNPALVKTGFDLFDIGGNHNFSTLIFYQCGYVLDTLRQASRRAYRIGQKLDCEVRYLYYVSSLQQSVIKLMSAKTQAACAIDGQFTAEGLAAMSAGEGESAAMLLAKMLVEKPVAPLVAQRTVEVSPASYAQPPMQAMEENANANRPRVTAYSMTPARRKQWAAQSELIRSAAEKGGGSHRALIRKLRACLEQLSGVDRQIAEEVTGWQELEKYFESPALAR